MAGDSETKTDLTAHQASYDRFMWWFKFGGVAVFIIAAIVIMLLA